MKKIAALVLVSLLCVSFLASCVGTTVIVGECNCNCNCNNQNPNPTPTPGGNGGGGSLKTGLSVSTSVSGSFSATAEKDGEAAFDITIAAVLVDSQGVIVSCIVDSVPATVKFNTNGKITSDRNATVLTKDELGDNYNMVAWGGAKAEWYEQIAAFEKYAEGKTVDQLKNGDIDMTTGKPKDGTDLSSSASIYLAGYVYAVEAAVNNATDLGAKTGDTLVLSTLNNVKSSADYTAASGSTNAKNGVAELDSDIVVLTRNGDTITSCYIDAVQAKVEFDATGKITTDLEEKIKTKNELGSDYNMVAWGGAKFEWNEQAASFAKYVTGKTAAEVANIAVTESTKPQDGTDLASSVTIAVGGFQALIAKAMQ